MSSQTLRFGLVGCGRVAPRHAKALHQIPNASLLAVCDALDYRAESFATKYEAEPMTDYHRLLERDDIDVVSICTPSGLHADMAVAAAQAGKHVVVEKPIALSTIDADRIIEAADEAKVKLCVVLQNRYNPPMRDIYDAVHSGRIGKPLLGNATVRWFRPQSYYEDGWHGTWSMDRGALMNQSIHHIDALQWLMGEIDTVFAFTATQAHEMEAEDTGVAVVRFKSGAIASIEGSTITYPQNIEGSVAVFGEKGSLKVGGTALNRKVMWRVQGELEQEAEIITADQVDPPSVYGTSHTHVIRDMVEAVLEDRQPKTHGTEGRISLAVVEALYQSALKGQPMQVYYG